MIQPYFTWTLRELILHGGKGRGCVFAPTPLSKVMILLFYANFSTPVVRSNFGPLILGRAHNGRFLVDYHRPAT